METRRAFLGSAVLASVALSPAALLAPSQAQDPTLRPPQPRRPGPDNDTNENPPLPDASKKILEENDKDMKKKVERLYQLAAELKEQVDKTDSRKVLSLDLVKKAEEIEKLAHDIKNRSKG